MIRVPRGAVAVLAALLLAGCQGERRSARAEVPVSFLGGRAEATLASVEAARSAHREGDTARVTSELADASKELRRLVGYFLPLLEARDRVAGAAGAVASSDVETAVAALDAAEAILLDVVRSHGPPLERKLRGPLERIEDARVAIEAGELGDARGVLDRLTQQLESLFYRGELVLEGSDPDTAPTSRRR